MKNTADPRDVKRQGIVSRIISGSLILSALDNCCTWIYNKLKTGLFARIFASERPFKRSAAGDSRLVAGRRRFVNKTEKSVVFNFLRALREWFMECRLKTIGVLLFSFSAVVGVIALLQGLTSRSGHFSADVYSALLLSGLVLIASVPLISSRKTLFGAICESRIMKTVLPAFGYYPEKMTYPGETGKSAVALFCGIVIGAASYFVDPLYVFGAIVALCALSLVMVRPEIGVVALFFVTPILPTMAVAAFLAAVVFSYFVKLIRGKWKLVFETLDFFVLLFAVLFLFGGFVSYSSESLKPALLKAWLIFGFFVTASVRQTRDWLKKYAISALSSASLVALYGIFQYFVGSKVSTTWLDKTMFSTISGRAVSTLENPNMLGEYLVMIIPIALAVIITGEYVNRRRMTFFTLIMGFCLVLTWSRGAWLGLIFAFVILMFIWHRRSLWLVFGGLVALPLASFVMPESILKRFTSIGNLADTSTAYRVNIWRGAVRMIRDHLFPGIGVGEGPWKVVYPDYTLPGIEQAPHSHNLFMQITVEMGIVALFVFLAVLFLSYRCGFSFFSKLSYSKDVDPSDLLSPGPDTRRADVKTTLRLASAGPLCGIFGVMIQGLTDYSWYNYRVFLLFWLVLGLGVSFAKNGREFVPDGSEKPDERGTDGAEVDISS